jgi:hypothetical protein
MGVFLSPGAFFPQSLASSSHQVVPSARAVCGCGRGRGRGYGCIGFLSFFFPLSFFLLHAQVIVSPRIFGINHMGRFLPFPSLGGGVFPGVSPLVSFACPHEEQIAIRYMYMYV